MPSNFDRENPSFLTFQVQSPDYRIHFVESGSPGNKLDDFRVSCAKSGITGYISLFGHLTKKLGAKVVVRIS